MSLIHSTTLSVSVALEGRTELVHRGVNRTARELHFKARTLVMLRINGENIRFGQVVFREGQHTYEDKDIPGVIEYLDAYEGSPAEYSIRLWVNTQVFEDLRTFDPWTHHPAIHASATPKNRETLGEDYGESWIAADEKQLVIDSLSLWIKSNSDLGELDEPIQEPERKMSPFEAQALATLQGMAANLQGIVKTLAWILGVVFGLVLFLMFFSRR